MFRASGSSGSHDGRGTRALRHRSTWRVPESWKIMSYPSSVVVEEELVVSTRSSTLSLPGIGHRAKFTASAFTVLHNGKRRSASRRGRHGEHCWGRTQKLGGRRRRGTGRRAPCGYFIKHVAGGHRNTRTEDARLRMRSSSTETRTGTATGNKGHHTLQYGNTSTIVEEARGALQHCCWPQLGRTRTDG